MLEPIIISRISVRLIDSIVIVTIPRAYMSDVSNLIPIENLAKSLKELTTLLYLHRLSILWIRSPYYSAETI